MVEKGRSLGLWVAAAAMGVVMGSAGLARADIDITAGGDFDTWTITGKEVYDLEDGEELSNILVDQSADGATLTIRARNKSGWVVRNVGFLGVGQDGDGSNSFQFQVSAPSGGEGLIENVWMSGKARDGLPGSQLGGIYIRASHSGHIDIRHSFIEGFGNNAVYGSAVGKDGGNEGSVAIENAYHRDNTVSQFRIGSPGSVVRNSVGIVNDPDGLRGGYPYSGSKNARGIWGKHFRGQRVENSSFYISADDVNTDGAFEARYIEDRSRGPEAVLEVVDCHVNEDVPTLTGSTSNARVETDGLDHSPTVTVIGGGGVPMSPEMAARGEREMPPELPGAPDMPEEELSRTLRIDASSARRSEYEIEVDGALRSKPGAGALESDDRTTGRGARGVVDGDEDAYAFSGTVTDFRLIGNASVQVDGDRVDPAMLGEHYPHTLQIDGTSAERTPYSFTVDGSLIAYDYLGGIGTGDVISGQTAEGFVNGGTDGYAFSGSLTDFTMGGSAPVLVDGERWDPHSCCEPAPMGREDAGRSGELEDGGGAPATTRGASAEDGGAGRASAMSSGAGCSAVAPSSSAGLWPWLLVMLAGRLRRRPGTRPQR